MINCPKTDCKNKSPSVCGDCESFSNYAVMTAGNEALKLAEIKKAFESQRSYSYKDNSFEQFANGYRIGIQTGRDQLQKELAEMKPTAYLSTITEEE